MAAAVSRAGLAFAPYPSMPPWPEGVALEDLWTELVEPLLHGTTTVGEILDVAETVRPDVLIIDCMMGAAFAAATKLGLPTAVLVHVRYRPFVDMWGDQIMHTSAIELLWPADLVLALTAPGFDGDADALPRTRRTSARSCRRCRISRQPRSRGSRSCTNPATRGCC